MKTYPCDIGECPYNAIGGYDCRNYCGYGVDESEINNDYSELNYNPCEIAPTR